MSKEKNIEKSIIKSKIYKAATLKECFIKNCNEKPINAHSIQLGGALSLIQSNVGGQQKVYTFTETELSEKGKVVFKPIGKKSASTFFGFCKSHDTQIFKEIENVPNKIDLSNSKHKFLLCLRAFAISYHRKKEDVNLFQTAKANESLKKKIKTYFDIDDKGFEFYLTGSKLAVKEMSPQRDYLINALNSKEYDSLHYFAYSVDYLIKFASTMLTSPPFLFSGEEINKSDDPNFEYSDIITTVIPLEKESIVVLASFKNRPNGIKYLKEIDEFQNKEKEIALTWHILSNSENVFFSPEWFDSLEENDKKQIIDTYLNSMDLKKKMLRYDSNKFKLNLFEKSKTET